MPINTLLAVFGRTWPASVKGALWHPCVVLVTPDELLGGEQSSSLNEGALNLMQKHIHSNESIFTTEYNYILHKAAGNTA